MTNDFILTTASNIEGYRIIKQCGVVFGETLFKHGFFSQLGAGLMNLGIGTRELEGSVSLIEKAREYAYSKMINEAKSRGANAIIAIDSDNTVGSDTMYLSLYGTAVKVVKEEEYAESIEKEKAKQAQIEEERIKTLLHQQQLEERRKKGEEIAEDVFLAAITDDITVASIAEKWETAGLASKYASADEIIRAKKSTEEKFGAFTGTQLNKIKQDLRIILLGE